MEQIQTNEKIDAATFVKTLNAIQRTRVDYVLNHIDETERSLELADDQALVVEALKEILDAETDKEATGIAKSKLAELL